MLKIRRSHDRLIFNMGIPIPGKDGLYIETGPRCLTLLPGEGTHCMKVTTYAPPFRPPFFRPLEDLYSFDPYI